MESSDLGLSVSLVPSSVRLQGLAAAAATTTETAAESSEQNLHDVIVQAESKYNDNSSSPRFFKEKKRRRQQQQQQRRRQQQQQQQQSYDPWKDIYQRGDFKSEGKRKLTNSNRRGDFDYVDYYDGIPVGAEYLYYGYDYDDKEDEDKDKKNGDRNSISRIDVNNDRDDSGNAGKWPYDFEKPRDKDPFSLSKQEANENNVRPQQFAPSLTRRVSEAVFSPVAAGVATVVGVPLLLAAAYWLFVENGPTPVVRARNLFGKSHEDFDIFDLLFRVVEEAVSNYARMS